jgi:hypothetical protein
VKLPEITYGGVQQVVPEQTVGQVASYESEKLGLIGKLGSQFSEMANQLAEDEAKADAEQRMQQRNRDFADGAAKLQEKYNADSSLPAESLATEIDELASFLNNAYTEGVSGRTLRYLSPSLERERTASYENAVFKGIELRQTRLRASLDNSMQEAGQQAYSIPDEAERLLQQRQEFINGLTSLPDYLKEKGIQETGVLVARAQVESYLTKGDYDKAEASLSEGGFAAKNLDAQTRDILLRQLDAARDQATSVQTASELDLISNATAQVADGMAGNGAAEAIQSKINAIKANPNVSPSVRDQLVIKERELYAAQVSSAYKTPILSGTTTQAIASVQKFEEELSKPENAAYYSELSAEYSSAVTALNQRRELEKNNGAQAAVNYHPETKRVVEGLDKQRADNFASNKPQAEKLAEDARLVQEIAQNVEAAQVTQQYKDPKDVHVLRETDLAREKAFFKNAIESADSGASMVNAVKEFQQRYGKYAERAYQQILGAEGALEFKTMLSFATTMPDVAFQAKNGSYVQPVFKISDANALVADALRSRNLGSNEAAVRKFIVNYLKGDPKLAEAEVIDEGQVNNAVKTILGTKGSFNGYPLEPYWIQNRDPVTKEAVEGGRFAEPRDIAAKLNRVDNSVLEKVGVRTKGTNDPFMYVGGKKVGDDEIKDLVKKVRLIRDNDGGYWLSLNGGGYASGGATDGFVQDANGGMYKIYPDKLPSAPAKITAQEMEQFYLYNGMTGQ